MSSNKFIDMQTEGFEDTLNNLEQLSNISDLSTVAVYNGSGIVADEMRRQLKSLKTTKDGQRGSDKTRRYCYERDKDVLLQQMGISKIRKDETTSAKVGFDGYYYLSNGKQKPVPLLANSINAGTSFMYAQPFINKTVRSVREKVSKAMQDSLDNEINKIQK